MKRKALILIGIIVCFIILLSYMPKGEVQKLIQVTDEVLIDMIGGKQYKLVEQDTIKIILEKDSPGIFYYNNGYYGYLCELLTLYAKHLDKEISFSDALNTTSIAHGLNSGCKAFAVTFDTPTNTFAHTTKLDNLKDSCKYVVLGNKRNPRLNTLALDTLLKYHSDSIIFKRGASYISCTLPYSLDYLKDTLSDRFLKTHEYVNLIRKNKYDFMVCKDEEALFYIFNYHDIIRTHKLDECIYSCVITNTKNTELLDNFHEWFDNFKNTEAYTDIVAHYKNDSYLVSFMKDGVVSAVHAISHYDHIFKLKAEGTLFNWRLLAAIACIESKFTPHLTSHKGAVGLMQVMPANTKEWGISREQLEDIDTNIECAIRILSNITRMLKFNSDGINDDELCITLAAYNGGYGHVTDAMRLARHFGEDSHSWVVVNKYLRLKRIPEYYGMTGIVRSGSFNSTETENYVNMVTNKYEEYKNRPVD